MEIVAVVLVVQGNSNKYRGINMAKEKKIVVLTFKLNVPITSEEAYEVVHNGRGKVAKKFRRYLSECLDTACRKCLKLAKEANMPEL